MGGSLTETNNNNIGNQIINEGEKMISSYNTPSKKPKYYSDNLQHLLRFPFFKQELMISNNSSQFKSAYLVNNQIIKKFKQIYQLKKLYDELESQKLLSGITYQYFDNDHYNKINDFLNNKKPEYINHLKKHEKPGGIKFKGNEIIFSPKYVNNQQNLEYIDNFEIIDKEYYNFLLQKFGEDLFMYKVNYASIENKIFLIIYYDSTNIYEIVSIKQDGGVIKVEYLIETILPKTGQNSSFENNSINTAILKKISNKDIQKLISMDNPIKIDNNISLKFHDVNRNLQQSMIANPAVGTNINLNNNFNTMALPMVQFYSPSPFSTFQQNTQNYNQNIRLAQPSPYNLNNNNNLMINQNIGNPVDERYYIIDNDLLVYLSSCFNQVNQYNYSHTKMIINQLNQNIPYINIDNLYLYKIKILPKKINNKDFYFPTNFQIIKQNELMKYLEILNNNHIKNELIEEICLIKIKGGFAFISKEFKSQLSNNLIFIYSIKKTGKNV